MEIGKAGAIFIQIDSDKYTPTEKAEAIYTVLGMATHNSFTKDTILRVTRYLFNMCYEVEGESPYPDGDRGILACARCGSGEYLRNEDGAENAYCGQCGQKIEWGPEHERV